MKRILYELKQTDSSVDSVDIIQTFVLPVSVKEKKSGFIYLENKLKI